MARLYAFIDYVGLALYKLVEEYKFFRRLSLGVSLYIAAYATTRVFSDNPPVITDGTAEAFGYVAALSGGVALLYWRGQKVSDAKKLGVDDA